MKKILIAIVMLSLTTVVSAQSNKTEKQQKSKTTEQKVETAPFAFESSVIDYGVINKGAPGEVVFRFKNTGKDPIIITSVNASCGCTVPKKPEEPVLPKKFGEIKVSYDTNRIGYFNKTISVTSNKNPDTPITLTIKGEVVNNE